MGKTLHEVDDAKSKLIEGKLTLIEHYEFLRNSEMLESLSMITMLLSSLLKILFKVNGVNENDDVFKECYKQARRNVLK